MRGRILFVLGLAVGYVLGTRAGRERYEQIAAAADRLWNSPPVQKQVVAVEDYLRAKAPDVALALADQTRKVVATVAARQKASAQKTAAQKKAASTAPASTAPATTSPAKAAAAKKPATPRATASRGRSSSASS